MRTASNNQSNKPTINDVFAYIQKAFRSTTTTTKWYSTMKCAFIEQTSLLLFLACAMMILHRTHGAASLDDAIALELDKYEGVGLTSWTVKANGTLCSVGVAGERVTTLDLSPKA
jgi:hypothetical protein